MTRTGSSARVARQWGRRLTARRGARITLAVALLAFLALAGALGRGTAPGSGPSAPTDAESSRVAALVATFPDADRGSVLLVATRSDGGALSEADRAAITALRPVASTVTGQPAGEPRISADGRAAVMTVTGAGDITALRTAIAQQVPDRLRVEVTGGPAFGADVAAAFDGANFTLLAVTIAIVAILLIITYRSPVLWLVPLTVVALADQLAGMVTAAAGTALGLHFDSGIISVLVFGAGTNYALLLISRYREELAERPDHRGALAAAWQNTAPAILASNVTVVLSLATLALAVIPGTRGLGVAAAIGLLIALAAVLLVLPAALAVCGRRIFWPLIPRPGVTRTGGGIWHRLAVAVMRRPARSLIGGLAVLGIMATGLIGTQIGLDQMQKFRVPSESAAGLATLSQHFDPGEAQPITIITPSPATEAVLDAIAPVPGVVRAHPVARSGDGSMTELRVIGAYSPGTPQSLQLIRDLRAAVHGADALVGGPVAEDLDARAGNARDLALIAPLVLAGSFLILVLLLRSFLAPLLLLTINLISAAAAIGFGAWLSRVIFAQPALDAQLPLLAFLFLVALGIDYTIFLVHRARREAASHGTRAGMVNAVTHTGSVITSAGVVLAAVFAALGVLPLVILGQLGLIVGVGVLVDTVLVRSVIVPALFGVLGERIWWPGKPPRDNGQSTYEQQSALVTTG